MSTLLAFDFETHLIQPGLLAPPIVCGSFASAHDSILVNRAVALKMLEENLPGSTILVGANVAYDFGCLLAARPDLFPLVWKAYEEARVFDVQLAASLNAIAEGRMRDGDLFRRDGSKIQSGRYSLDECVREWLGRDDAKSNATWRLSYALLEHLPIESWPAEARQYPIDDAVNTLQVAEAQLKSAKNLSDLPRQAHAAFCLHLGAMWGLRTDPERVSVLASDIDKHLTELRDYAVEQGFMRPKSKKEGAPLAKDTKAIKEAVFKAYMGTPPKTEGGDISASRETLTDSGDPVLVKFSEISKWEKLQTYVPTLVEATKAPLNVKPNPLLSTGRTSYEGLIQLMPRKGGIRETFVARPGRVMCSVDYAAIEMSTLAQAALWSVGYSDLADAINADQDPHCILGADLIGVSYEEFKRRVDAKDAKAKDIRQAGKAGNFGFPGMMGAVRFVEAQKNAGFSVCEWFFGDGKCREERVREWQDEPLAVPLCKRCIEQAEHIRTAYLMRWKEIRPYWKWVMSEIEANDAITQFVSKRVRGAPNGPAAANTLFQGLAADGAKRAVVHMTREMYLDKLSALYGSRLLIFAHDETICEHDEATAHEAAYRQAQVMVAGMREVVPDVKVKAEPALMKFWYKGAEAVFKDAKLVPWEPKEKAA